MPIPVPAAPTMSFGDALEALKVGQRATRAVWATGTWIVVVPSSTVTVAPDDPLGIAVPELVGTQVTNPASFVQMTADGITRWAPLQADLLAQDWTLVTAGVAG